MAAKTKSGTASHSRESDVSMLSEFVRQGTESFFATQRILVDLATRQNTTTIDALRERLDHVRTAPVAALTEMAGEGLSNFIAAQRVLLQLTQRQNDLLLAGIAERSDGVKPVGAMAELLRRGIDTFLEMQQQFLTMAAKQADVWIDNAKEGKAFDGKGMPEIAREAMDTFIRSQKKFLDAVAEETAHATGAKNGKERTGKKTEIAELARQGMEAFIDVQKKLLDLAAQQVGVNVKVARRTIEMLNPLPPITLAGLTRHTVDSFVAAQKALLQTMSKPAHAAETAAHAHPQKPHKPARKRAHRTPAAAVA